MKLDLLVYGLIALALVVPGYFIIGDMFPEPEAAYRLVKVEMKKSCPQGDHLAQTASRAGKPAGLKDYCFVLNVNEGDCLKRSSAFHERVACGTVGSQRVSKVTASPGRSVCGDREARTCPDPAMTVCLEKP